MSHVGEMSTGFRSNYPHTFPGNYVGHECVVETPLQPAVNRVCLPKLCYLNASEALEPQVVLCMTTFLKDCTS